MRDIIFRGKRVDNGEWIEGYCVCLNEKAHFIYSGYAATDCGTYFYCPEYYKVIPETVGQYTGLTDKNGTTIFEGDVVSTDLTRPYLIVEFRQGCFMYNCNDGERDYYDIMLPILDKEQTCDKCVRVIGNIHDNPELLKGGDTNA